MGGILYRLHQEKIVHLLLPEMQHASLSCCPLGDTTLDLYQMFLQDVLKWKPQSLRRCFDGFQQRSMEYRRSK